MARSPKRQIDPPKRNFIEPRASASPNDRCVAADGFSMKVGLTRNASIHMLRMAAGLARDQCERLVEIVESDLSNYGLQVTVYLK